MSCCRSAILAVSTTAVILSLIAPVTLMLSACYSGCKEKGDKGKAELDEPTYIESFGGSFTGILAANAPVRVADAYVIVDDLHKSNVMVVRDIPRMAGVLLGIDISRARAPRHRPHSTASS